MSIFFDEEDGHRLSRVRCDYSLVWTDEISVSMSSLDFEGDVAFGGTWVFQGQDTGGNPLCWVEDELEVLCIREDFYRTIDNFLTFTTKCTCSNNRIFT